MFNKIAFDLAPNGVAAVMLNRPHVLNAITQSMLEDFDNLWKRMRTDDAIRVVVIHGHPDARGFSSGADVRGGDYGCDGIARDANVFVNRSVAEYLCPRLYGVWKPVITAVHGICAGRGYSS
jgi:enoyl-CoA hydratase/carnithine racemase